MRQYFIIFFIALFFVSKANALYAPVVEATAIERIPKNGIHYVHKGETFYSIAWRYGLDYRTLANKNYLKPPYNIEIGQKIYLQGFAPRNEIVYAHSVIFRRNINEPIAPVAFWHWPSHGRIVNGYSSFNKGINITGKKGDPVYAAAGGKVVYNGDGLRSYGNLIIIKHNSKYLTAYAHNAKILVKQGQWVKAGQKIAEMGSTGTNRVILHFEIRKNGAPVNPLNFLSRY